MEHNQPPVAMLEANSVTRVNYHWQYLDWKAQAGYAWDEIRDGRWDSSDLIGPSMVIPYIPISNIVP